MGRSAHDGFRRFRLGALIAAASVALSACGGQGVSQNSATLPSTAQLAPISSSFASHAPPAVTADARAMNLGAAGPAKFSPGAVPAAALRRTTTLTPGWMDAHTSWKKRPENIQNVPGWTQYAGVFKQVVVSPADGTLFALVAMGSGPDYPIAHFSAGTWSAIPGMASRIAIGPFGDLLYAVNSGGGIWQYSIASQSWTSIGGGAIDVTVARNNTVYAVSNGGADGAGNHPIYHYAYGRWTGVTGRGVRIAASWDPGTYAVYGGGTMHPDGFYVYNSAGALFYYSPAVALQPATYLQFAGQVQSIAPIVGGIFAVGSGGVIYFFDYYSQGWNFEPGSAASVAATATQLLAVDADGSLWGTPLTIAGPKPIAASKIKHVIFIIQENRSFDSLFSGFPGADGATSGMNKAGQTIPLRTGSFDEYWDPDHYYHNYKSDVDGGLQDGFESETWFANAGAPSPTPPLDWAYLHVNTSETTEYWDLAHEYSLGDRMFQSNDDASFVAHQFLIAGQAGHFVDVPVNFPWGCDAKAGTTSSILDPDGSIVLGPFPCVNYPTLGDELDNAHISWKYYAPKIGVDVGGSVWTAYDAIRHIRYGADWAKITNPETTILSDISNNTLPQMSWVVPAIKNSDHARGESKTGPAWVASIVNGVLGNPTYSTDTAIFIVWDDWGGWYDHVAPPYRSVYNYGMRVPLIAVSAYAKHGYVSHVQHDFGSMLRYTEELFNLPTLGGVDAYADDLSDMFDYTQTVSPSLSKRAMVKQSYSVEDVLRASRESQASGLPPDNE